MRASVAQCLDACSGGKSPFEGFRPIEEVAYAKRLIGKRNLPTLVRYEYSGHGTPQH